jgi:hypothetical protein
MRNALFSSYMPVELGVCITARIPLMEVIHVRHRRDSTPREPGRWMRRLAWTTTRLSPLWRMSIERRAPDGTARRACVVVANHESNRPDDVTCQRDEARSRISAALSGGMAS